MDSVSALDLVTLVIPTRDREDHLRRLLRSLARTPVHVLLLNNGDRKITLSGDIDRNVPLNIREVHAPGDFPGQMRMAGGLIETPMAMNVDDDSAIDVYALGNACRFLLDCGDETSHAAPLGRLDHHADHVTLQAPRWPACIPRLTSNLLEDPIDRVRFQLAHQWRQQGWYALSYSRKYQESMKVAASVIGNISSLSVTEVLSEYMHAWLGPIVSTGRVIQYRSNEKSHPDYGRWVSFEEWTDSKRFAIEFHRVSELLAGYCRDGRWGNRDVQDLLRMSARDTWRARYRRKFTGTARAFRFR